MRSSTLAGAALAAIPILLLTAGCTGLISGKLFKERAAETPAPSDEIVDKSFFVDPSGHPKTFMCALAPEVARGSWGEQLLQPFVNFSDHCNVEFDLSNKDYLIGRVVHPSFPHDRTRWKELIRIPIHKHFYYEKDKDAHGREINRWIENESRSEWSARPKMKLDLGRIQIHDVLSNTPYAVDVTWSGASEIEWDMTKGFLGFSLDAKFTHNRYWQDPDYQAKFRVNFMEFKHDPKFTKVPYHQENSRFLNALHVMGRQVEGVEPELYTGHWDLSETHDLYFNGVPKALEKIVANAIYRWNEQLQASGLVPKGKSAFRPVIKNLKHPFDLRYPTLTWISDRRISEYGPLGIGLASADVRNGKILWGSLVLFGGALEEYINRNTAVTDGSSPGGAAASMRNMLSPVNALTSFLPTTLKLPSEIDRAGVSGAESYSNRFLRVHPNFLIDQMKRLSLSQVADDRQIAEKFKKDIEEFKNGEHNVPGMAEDFLKVVAGQQELANGFFAQKSIPQLLGFGNKETDISAQKVIEATGDSKLAQVMAERNPSARAQLARNLRPQTSPYLVETDLTIQNLLGGLMASPARRDRSYQDMLESVVMQLVLHEFGHFLGLGHQFKENIVPEKGSVPNRFYDDLLAKATPEREFTNQSSVMGYPDGRVHMVIPANEQKPGPHDDLVLRYLYAGQYSSYDPQADDFVFTKVPPSGKIPERAVVTTRGGKAANLATSYFPQCNDYEASLGADPYCNRWDRGSTATEITKSYFERLSDNLLANLYSLVGGGWDAEMVELNFWYASLGTFMRVRMFYDEMRRRLRSEPHLKNDWNRLRTDRDALFEFADACKQKNPTDPAQVRSEVLRSIFADKSMVDLCRANGLALDEIGFFLNLPDSDYSQIDHKNRYISSGYLAGDAVHNTGHIFGSWYQMSNFPLKFTSLFYLTASMPFSLWRGRLLPNPYYDYPKNKFLYRTLYPRKYTRLISETVLHNMRFAATGAHENTTIGRAILAAGSLIPRQRHESNDDAKLLTDYNDMLNQQTEFENGIVAILISATPQDPVAKGKTDHYKKFTAQIFDFMSGRETTARDVFILPKGRVLAWANKMFLFPLTSMKFYKGTDSYVFAYKVAYDYKPGDRLIEDSVKSALMEKHNNEIAAACVNGFGGNGLLSYFDPSNPEFDGFKIPPGIASEVTTDKITIFHNSIETEFAKYEARANKSIPAHFPIKEMRTICDQAIRGIGQISAAASLINGQWLGVTADYLEK